MAAFQKNTNSLKKTPPRLRGLYFWARNKLLKNPSLVNLEFTKHCNAKCGFCACWEVESPNELKDYAPLVSKFKPVVCAVSGGEPLLRKNFDELLAGIRPHCHYLAVITNGALLDEDKADRLARAGVNQVSVSLDFIGDKHSEQRKIEGLYEHIEKLLPKLSAKGYRIALNTIIMDANLEHIIPLAHKAKEWGVKISYSSYCTLKKDKNDFMINPERFEKLKSILVEIKRLKREMGHIKNTDYYLDNIISYFKTGGIGNCQAGKKWLQATPNGFIQQCSELPIVSRWEDYDPKAVQAPACSKCWYTCRGESEAPALSVSRIRDLIRA